MFDKEFIFKGKHAELVNELTDKEYGIFNRNLDVLFIAPLIGLHYNQLGAEESTGKTTKIFVETLIKEQRRLKFLYRLVMLLNSQKPDVDERIKMAFKEGSKETVEENNKIFTSYVLGGVEKLHEKLLADMTASNYEEDLLENMYQLINEFDYDLRDADDLDIVDFALK